MTSRPLIRFGAMLVIAASAVFVTACTTTPPTSGPGAATPAPTSPSPTPDTVQTVAPGSDPECDTIIPGSVVADFESLGWSAKSDSFRINGVPVDGGIECRWGDYTIASDRVQIFGWAPIAPDDAVSAEAELVAAGWRREDGTDGVYITENASTAIATDEDGYGLTYLFADGWVKFADTKQGLLLVQWPPTP